MTRDKFTIKDSGERKQFASGMVRDTAAGKIEYHRVLEGPMLGRWAEHLTKGAAKYPDNPDGSANWTLAEEQAEFNRFKASAFRHFMQLLNGDKDEDHAAAVFFNINGMMYVLEKMRRGDLIQDWIDADNDRSMPGPQVAARPSAEVSGGRLRLFDEAEGIPDGLFNDLENSFDRMPDK